MKGSSKKSLEKRGILIAGRAQNAGGSQVHADKRRTPRNLEKQRLKTQVQHETARNRGPFSFFVEFAFSTPSPSFFVELAPDSTKMKAPCPVIVPAVAVTSHPFRRPC